MAHVPAVYVESDHRRNVWKGAIINICLDLKGNDVGRVGVLYRHVAARGVLKSWGARSGEVHCIGRGLIIVLKIDDLVT